MLVTKAVLFFPLKSRKGNHFFIPVYEQSFTIRIRELLYQIWGFSGGSVSKESDCNAGGSGSIPGLGRSHGEKNGKPLQYSCLENPMARWAWWATVHEVKKSQTLLSDFHSFILTKYESEFKCDFSSLITFNWLNSEKDNKIRSQPSNFPLS